MTKQTAEKWITKKSIIIASCIRVHPILFKRFEIKRKSLNLNTAKAIALAIEKWTK